MRTRQILNFQNAPIRRNTLDLSPDDSERRVELAMYQSIFGLRAIRRGSESANERDGKAGAWQYDWVTLVRS